MEYIFGTDRLNGVEVENLKTAGDAHSDLEGYVEVRRVYDDSVICDRFRIVEKYRSMENEESCKQKSIAEVKKVPQNLHS